ncbi:Isochorismatase-like protein [Ochromonadaceae sp. CCMP2298]|nr:Isochorismatase-like protein [Ochromonadaceae sp. CCMP2298]
MSGFLTTGLRRLVQSNTILFICDVQERFRPLIYNSETVISKCAFLSTSMHTLDIPCIVTEQYPKAFGKTVPEILLHPTTQVFEKKQFSMLTEEVRAALSSSGRRQVVLCGIEGHVCVLQSAMELLDSGYEVHVVADAVSSQRCALRPSSGSAAHARQRPACTERGSGHHHGGVSAVRDHAWRRPPQI